MNRRSDTTVDLSIFDGKMPWEERRKLLAIVFPQHEKLDWGQVFRQDPTVLGKIINDIIKHDQAKPGRPGKRPSLDVPAAEQSLRVYQNEDFSILPFREAFMALKGTRSIRHMAQRCDLTATMVQRIIEGRANPTTEIMEKVATGCKKSPSYFQEWRVNYILSILAARLDDAPESSIVQYTKMKGLIA